MEFPEDFNDDLGRLSLLAASLIRKTPFLPPPPPPFGEKDLESGQVEVERVEEGGQGGDVEMSLGSLSPL